MRSILALCLVVPLLSTSVAVAQIAAPSATEASAYERLDQAESGLVGNLYRAQRTSNGAGILVLGGSEGGLSGGQARVAKALADEGYTVLHLAHFGLPGLPKALREIPLEYFRSAVDWLVKQPDVDQSRVGVVAVSKGAEGFLIFATRDDRIRAVVAGAPASHVWIAVESCGVDTASSWSENGQPVAALDCGHGPDVSDALSAYAAGLAASDEHPETAIPIERARAKLLLICGEADSLSPACDQARRLMDRARPGQAELLAYADAGHAGFGIPVSPDDPNYPRLAALGGTADGNDQARSESWPRILAFLEETLLVSQEKIRH